MGKRPRNPEKYTARSPTNWERMGMRKLTRLCPELYGVGKGWYLFPWGPMAWERVGVPKLTGVCLEPSGLGKGGVS